MGKRAEFKAQRKRQQQRQNFLLLSLIVVAAVAIVLILVWPNLEAMRNDASPTAISRSTDIVVPPAVPYPTDLVPAGEAGAGDPAASVKLEIFSDFQCPACARFSEDIEPLILTNYVETGKVYLVYHPYSFLDSGTVAQESHKAAEAAFCALDQGVFWQYHDILFANQTGENVGDFTERRLVAFAEKIGLDMTNFEECLTSNRYQQKVLEEAQFSVDQGVTSTPSFFINGQKVELVSSFNELIQALDAALK